MAAVAVVFFGIGLPQQQQIQEKQQQGSHIESSFLPTTSKLTGLVDEHLAQLNIVGTNIWGGSSIETLAVLTPEQLNPVPPNPINSIFKLSIFDFVIILLVMLLVTYLLYRILQKYYTTLLE